MQINTEGLIVKEQDIGDGDKLVTVLTDKFGIIRSFAKGVKNIKNKNAVSTQLFCYSDFVIYKGKNKYIINESDPKELFFELRKDIEKLSLAQYFCELLIFLVPEGLESRDFLKLTLNSLYYLAKKKCKNGIIKSIFEMRVMTIAGYMPNLVCCKSCRAYEDNCMYFVAKNGEIYCQKCYSKNKIHGGVLLNRGAVTALRHIVYSDFNKLFSFDLSNDSIKMLNRASEEYILTNTNRSFNTLEFYNQISGDL